MYSRHHTIAWIAAELLATACTAVFAQPAAHSHNAARPGHPSAGVCRAGRAAPAALKIESAWARATVAGQRSSGAYLVINNTGDQPATLLGACSPAVKTVQMHDMHMEGDVMEMRELDHVSVPAQQSVAFKSGGLHLMLMDLPRPLQAGSTLPLVLHFDKGDVTVQAPVRGLNPAPPASAP